MGEPFVLDAEFVKFLSTLGIGGVLAALIFYFYRKDVKQFTDLWKLATESMTLIVKENTASNTKLITLIETMEKNSIRRTDISQLIEQKINERKDTPNDRH